MRTLLPSMLLLFMLSVGASPVQSQQAHRTQTFASFWTQFKAAVATKNKEAVAALTTFPFPFESGEITRGEFIAKYHRIFNRQSQRCIGSGKLVRDKESYLVFCGEEIYVFARVEGTYKLVDIGVND